MEKHSAQQNCGIFKSNTGASIKEGAAYNKKPLQILLQRFRLRENIPFILQVSIR